jgi:hypothetical protein
MRSEARTVQEYLKNASPNDRVVLTTVREHVLANLPDGYVESMRWGMPTYEVPLERFPNTYNGEPLAFVSFAEQKRNCSLYLMSLYSDSPLEQDFRKRWNPPSGRRLDMGKSCVRFRALKDLDLDLIGEVIRATTVDEFIETYDRSRDR